MTKIIYEVDLKPENAEVIDKINRLLIADYSESSPRPSSDTPHPSPQETDTQSKPKKSNTELDALKKAAKAAKKEHGESFCLEVLDSLGIKVKDSLGKSISAISKDDYEEVMNLWKAGPQESEEEPEDDDFEDDSEEEAAADVDPEAVVKAIKAYAKSEGKDEARAMLKKHGFKKPVDIPEGDMKNIVALFKDLV